MNYESGNTLIIASMDELISYLATLGQIALVFACFLLYVALVGAVLGVPVCVEGTAAVSLVAAISPVVSEPEVSRPYLLGSGRGGRTE